MILPKEHGAYGQLLFPLMTAMAIGRPGVAAFAFAGASIAAFVAHEPLLVWLGQRGSRASRALGAEARRCLSAFVVTTAAFGAVAIFLMPATARRAVLAPVLCTVILGIWIVRGREHTTSGEILSGLALASLALPIGVASHASVPAALTCALAYAGAFIVATVSVRAIILVTRRRADGRVRLGAAVVCLAVLATLAWLPRSGIASPAGFWAALPVCAVGLVMVAIMPEPRHLRTIGWTLVGTTAVTAVVLIASLR